VDVNQKVIYKLDATEDWHTESIDASKDIEFLIIPENITGSGGLLTYYQSLDNINWNIKTFDDMITEVSYDISDNLVKTLKDFRVVQGYLKFVYAAGSVTDGTLTIKVYNE
jgi:hypothetical protein